MRGETRCGWCRRPPQDYPTCDTSPCGLLVAECEVATDIAKGEPLTDAEWSAYCEALGMDAEGNAPAPVVDPGGEGPGAPVRLGTRADAPSPGPATAESTPADPGGEGA